MPLEYKISAVMAMTRYYKSYPVRKTDSFGALLSPPVISICDVPSTYPIVNHVLSFSGLPLTGDTQQINASVYALLMTANSAHVGLGLFV